MKEWVSLRDLAAAALPGLPGTVQGLSRYAGRHGWTGRSRSERGGGTEYHYSTLPSAARAVWIASHLTPAEPDPELDGPAPNFSAFGAVARDARLVILSAFDTMLREHALPIAVATEAFCTSWNSGRRPAETWVRDAVPRLSPRTLRRWRSAALHGATERLAVDRGASRRGRGLLDIAEAGSLKTFVLAQVSRQPHLSAWAIRQIVLDKFGATLRCGHRERPIPDIRVFQLALKAWKTEYAAELLQITNPDAFKSRMRVSGSRAHLVTRLNELWEIDASPADVLTTDGRYAIYVAIDVYSRRITCLITKTARAEAVGLMLRKAILAWGVPERIKTDNGSDFVARSSRRLLGDLGIEHDPANPFSPEEKGVVERAIGTLQRRYMTLLPGFIGHSVADRKAIEGRRRFAERLGAGADKVFQIDLSPADLQDKLDRLIDTEYAHRPHAGLQNHTPYQVAAAWPHAVRRVRDAEALGLLLAPVPGRDGTRTVGKRGVQVDGLFYILPGLMPGDSVMVRMDPADLGRAHVFDDTGTRFLGVAVAPEVAGIDPAAVVAEARIQQARHIRDRTAEIRAEARRIKPRDMVDAVLRNSAKAAGKLVELPRPARTHLTPAIEAAGAAVRDPDPIALPLSSSDAGLLAAIEADLAAAGRPTNVTPLRTSDTPQQRYRRALDIRTRQEAGQTIAPEEAFWLGGYEQGPEHRSMTQMFEDFGEAALR